MEAEALRRVALCLETCGYAVTRLSGGSSKQPDLLATSANDRLLVEVKMNEGPPLVVGERGVASVTRNVDFSNTMSRVIKKATRQLVGRGHSRAGAFRVLAYAATGLDPEGRLEQVQSTLYGLMDLLDLDDESTEEPLARPCFYFRHGEFYRHRDLDAAILLTTKKGKVCLNNYGTQVSGFRDTLLWSRHLAVDAVRDPDHEEQAGKAFLVRESLDRRDEAAVLDYVRRTYSTGRLISLPWKRHTAVAHATV